ncbi:hypothetical protein LDENG_00149840 [Lucifuga dentata]|nr:hypothetical protein LDENG_00149840 [Lucifuga dentata]
MSLFTHFNPFHNSLSDTYFLISIDDLVSGSGHVSNSFGTVDEWMRQLCFPEQRRRRRMGWCVCVCVCRTLNKFLIIILIMDHIFKT